MGNLKNAYIFTMIFIFIFLVFGLLVHCIRSRGYTFCPPRDIVVGVVLTAIVRYILLC
jgi:hypothetical protein